MTVQKVGLGAGNKEFSTANLLRLWIGEAVIATAPSSPTLWGEQETIVALQTQLDDIQPQAIGYLFDQLYHQGAIEVFTTAIGMKKNRPGILLTVLCFPGHQAQCQNLLFRETTTLGIRVQPQTRYALQREWQTVEVWGETVRIKLGFVEIEGRRKILNTQPEFRDCVALARKNAAALATDSAAGDRRLGESTHRK